MAFRRTAAAKWLMAAWVAGGVVVSASSAFGQAATSPSGGSHESQASNARETWKRSIQMIHEKLDQNREKKDALLTSSVLADPEARLRVRQDGIALLNERLELLKQLTRLTPRGIDRTESLNIEATMYILGDEATVGRVDATAGAATEEGGKAAGVKFMAKWLAAGGDESRQDAVVDELEALGRTNPKNIALTESALELNRLSPSEAVKKRLMTFASETMDNSLSKQVASALAVAGAQQSMREAQRLQQEYVGKPMEITGTTVDGKSFTSGSYKGKVVLVDFWATWCGPCVAEMPKVKALYEKYHDEGLEIVGVSGDQTPEPLVEFVGKRSIPWVQLYDPATRNEVNPIFKKFNIAAIPTMFVIDRHGICRSVAARGELEKLIPELIAESK